MELELEGRGPILGMLIEMPVQEHLGIHLKQNK